MHFIYPRNCFLYIVFTGTRQVRFSLKILLVYSRDICSFSSFSPTKADFIRAKYQFLAFVNKHKDSELSTAEDLSKVRVYFVSNKRKKKVTLQKWETSM